MKNQPSLLKMEEQVHSTIQARSLLSPGDRIVVAVSGGPDSVALLSSLVALSTRWNWDLSIAHVNHGLRGAESDEDAIFVEQLGNHFDVPVNICDVALTKQDAKLTKQSFQSYARHVRYHALGKILEERGATKLATGHTADDQAETVLMWMLRGSGTGGLSGIPSKRGEKIVRPILDRTRSEIMAYLNAKSLTYRLDSSNNQAMYLRNRLRHELVPQLKQYSPGIIQVLSRQAEIIQDDHVYLESVASQAFQGICEGRDERTIQLNRTGLLGLPLSLQRRIVRQAFQSLHGKPQGPRFDAIQRLLDLLQKGQSGWTLQIHAVDVRQEYEQLILSKQDPISDLEMSMSPLKEIGVAIPGEVIWPLTGQRLAMSVNQVEQLQEEPQQQHACEIHLDAESFSPQLRLRSWRPGDVFCPSGLGGRQKKLQDFFSDIKLPRSQRRTVPLLVAPEGILWIGGLRGDERFQASSTTKSLMIASISR